MYIVQIFIRRQNPVGKKYFQNGNRFFETHEYIGGFQYFMNHGMYDADNKMADMFEINYENGLSVHVGRPLIWDKKSI